MLVVFFEKNNFWFWFEKDGEDGATADCKHKMREFDYFNFTLRIFQNIETWSLKPNSFASCVLEY